MRDRLTCTKAARKKLESRRLAYDTAVAKMDKLKKDDFRVEEEHRSAKEKYEYSVIEVRQRMDDIKEAEADSVADLHSFLDAELKYHDRCKEALMLLKDKWPQTLAAPLLPDVSFGLPLAIAHPKRKRIHARTLVTTMTTRMSLLHQSRWPVPPSERPVRHQTTLPWITVLVPGLSGHQRLKDPGSSTATCLPLLASPYRGCRATMSLSKANVIVFDQ